jgi:hypothetical protein
MRLFIGPTVFCVVQLGRQCKRFLQTGNRFCSDLRTLLDRKQQPLGHQKTMKNAKSVIALVFLVILFVTTAWAEYDLAMHFRIASSVASICGLIVLLGALLRAPEGYEDENGFHVGALADAGLL